MNTCATCQFWRIDEGTSGTCRRYPHYETRWASNWCGEFKLLDALQPCRCCGKPIGKTPRVAPHLDYAMPYPVCQDCHDKFAAGTHPYQQEKKP